MPTCLDIDCCYFISDIPRGTGIGVGIRDEGKMVDPLNTPAKRDRSEREKEGWEGGRRAQWRREIYLTGQVWSVNSFTMTLECRLYTSRDPFEVPMATRGA